MTRLPRDVALALDAAITHPNARGLEPDTVARRFAAQHGLGTTAYKARGTDSYTDHPFITVDSRAIRGGWSSPAAVSSPFLVDLPLGALWTWLSCPDKETARALAADLENHP